MPPSSSFMSTETALSAEIPDMDKIVVGGRVMPIRLASMVSLELRPVTRDQAEEICALINRCEEHDGVPRVLSVEELLEDFDSPFVDVAVDTRAAYRDDALAGWGWVWNPPSEVAQEKAYLFGEVDPAHRGTGVGRTLLAWCLTRAEERLRSRDHDLPRYIRVDAFDELEDRHRLYARFGFSPVRWFEELARPLTELPPVEVPAGVVLVPWPNDRDEELLVVCNAAFADHWGSTPMDAETWHQQLHGHGARLNVSVVALDDASGEVVAVCLNHAYPEDDERTGRREAWIHNLGTLREWRKRGVASALITWSLHAFAENGFTHAMLGVDADNPTGAARLYRDLGFELERRSTTREVELAAH